MDNSITDQAVQSELSKSSSGKRSASYPAFTVSEAFNFALKINEKFGNIEVTRKEIATVFKVHPNTISRDVAAVAAYGFFDKTLHKGDTDVKYKLNDLFLDTFRPENEKQKKINFITAFGKPKLYADLIAKFDGTLIPEEFPNTLIKHHGITEGVAKEVAEIFIRAGMEVGVINENKVLNYKVTLSTVQKTQYAEIIEETNNADLSGSNSSNIITNPPAKIERFEYAETSDKKIPIILTKGKMCYLVYPDNITSNDIKLIEYEIKGILLRLELEKQEEEEEQNRRKEKEQS